MMAAKYPANVNGVLNSDNILFDLNQPISYAIGLLQPGYACYLVLKMLISFSSLKPAKSTALILILFCPRFSGTVISLSITTPPSAMVLSVLSTIPTRESPL